MEKLKAFFQGLKGSHIPKLSNEKADCIAVAVENQNFLGIDCCDVTTS